MKKGFTLVEIILSIVLITIIGISGFFMYKADKKEKTLEKMKEDIYRAANVLIETDSETKEQLYNSKNGAIIPLKKLESEGLIDFNGLNIEDEYVLSMLGSTEESEKCSGTLYNIGSWTKATDDVIYICGSGSLSTEVKDYIDEKIDEINGTSDVLKEAIINNAKKADGTTARSVIDLNNIITTGTINTLSKIEDEYVFKRNTIDNYVNFNGMCWRATRIQADGSIKLLLEDKDSTCDSADYSGELSIGQGHFGYTKDEPVSGYKKADYLNGKTDKENSMKYILEEIWLDNEFSSAAKAKMKNNSWIIEDVNSTVSVYGDSARTEPVELSVSLKTAMDKATIINYDYAFYNDTTTFNSYIAPIRAGELQPYMFVGYEKYWLLDISALTIDPGGHSICDFVNVNKIVYLGARCTNSLSIRPMIVLKDGVKITGGVGTQINPYVIAE